MNLDLAQALNSQLTYERYSADVYYSLAVQLDTLNLTGMSAYMMGRMNEERTHAKKFSDYLADRNVFPIIDALKKPELALIHDPMMAGIEAFSGALAHERTVTARIWELFYKAESVEDAATEELMHWYIHEQVEEERSLEEIVTKFRLATGNGAAILALNDELKG
jgi:ferritin